MLRLRVDFEGEPFVALLAEEGGDASQEGNLR